MVGSLEAGLPPVSQLNHEPQRKKGWNLVLDNPGMLWYILPVSHPMSQNIICRLSILHFPLEIEHSYERL